ncbi:MAG: AAA family ATPase, partial [Tannerella sp.]|nr:AAA family ATPase [Tannerella sp.]
MTTLKHIRIENFRGFDALEIDGFSKINLFVGKNNSGKTSILEALFLIFGMSNPSIPGNINKIRGLGFRALSGQFKYLFHNLKLENKPSFYAKFDDASERWLDLETKYKQNEFSNDTSSMFAPEVNGIGLNFAAKKKQNKKKSYTSSLIFKDNDDLVIPDISKDYVEDLYATFISSEVKDNASTLVRYADIIKKKGGDAILQVLKTFDENIIDIQPLNDGIYFNIKDVPELMPCNVLGDGIRRFLNIVTAVSEKQNAFILIDEIENGLHYSAYKLLWKSLLVFSRQNDVQLFITTHNIETLSCLKAVLEECEFE